MIKGVTHAHLGLIWYYADTLDFSYSPNQFLGWDFFGTSVIYWTVQLLWIIRLGG